MRPENHFRRLQGFRKNSDEGHAESPQRYRTTFYKMTISFVVFGLIPLMVLSMLFFCPLQRDDTGEYDCVLFYDDKLCGG